MGFALLLAAALAWWLHQRGELLPNLKRFGGAALAGVIAVRLLTSGKPLMGIIAAVIAIIWWQVQARRQSAVLPEAETAALAVLGLEPGAGIGDIQAAFRARMAEAHPDAGGSDEAARSVTAARDLLLDLADQRARAHDPGPPKPKP
jgi:hypothetical protein